MGLRLLVLLALAAAGTAPADACPAGTVHCMKYRRMPPPPLPQPTVVRYARTLGGTLDRVDRASIVRFLTGSTWDLVVGGKPERIRFVDPREGHFARPPEHQRNVLVREVERTRGGIIVGLDGQMFTLTACRIGRAVSACLELAQNVDLYGGATYGG